MKTLFLFLSILIMVIMTYGEGLYNCKDSDRTNRICPLYATKLCGWYYPKYCTNINGVGSICAENTTNSCFACHNTKIEKVTVGDCPSI